MNVFLTVATGVSVFVVGQICLKLLVEPVHDLKRTIGKIAYALTHHANVVATMRCKPVQERTEKELKRDAEVSDLMRSLSSDLHTGVALVPLYQWTRRAFGLPKIHAVGAASGELLGLSNGVKGAEASKYCDSIRNALGIPQLNETTA